MIHLAHAASQLTRVVRAIGFPLATARAPPGPAVDLALKDVLAIKRLEARAVGVRVDRRPAVRVGSEAPAASAPLLPATFPGGLLLLLGVDVGFVAAEGNEARVCLDGDEGAEICHNHEEEEDKVERDEDGAEGDIVLFLDVVFNCITKVGKRVRGGGEHKGQVARVPDMCPTMA